MGQTAQWFAKALEDQFGATSAERVDWVGDTIKAAIVKAVAVIDQDSDRYWSTHEANEAAGAGYSAGGVTLASKSVDYEPTTKTVQLKCDDISIDPITLTTARYLLLYKDTGVAATSPLIGYLDFGVSVSPVALPFNVFWDVEDGALRLVLGSA